MNISNINTELFKSVSEINWMITECDILSIINSESDSMIDRNIFCENLLNVKNTIGNIKALKEHFFKVSQTAQKYFEYYSLQINPYESGIFAKWSLWPNQVIHCFGKNVKGCFFFGGGLFLYNLFS